MLDSSQEAEANCVAAKHTQLGLFENGTVRPASELAQRCSVCEVSFTRLGLEADQVRALTCAGQYLSSQTPGNACRPGGRHPSWHDPGEEQEEKNLRNTVRKLVLHSAVRPVVVERKQAAL